MIKDNERKEKMCLFFASDYHFEMISLPYISKNLDKDKKVIMIPENNLEETVEKVLEGTNLANDKKDKIMNIDWKNNNLDKFKQVKDSKNRNLETVIFVKGTENYINNINENIKNWTNIDNVQIIDCYDINEVHEDINTIAKGYGNILSTSGIESLLH